MQNKLSSDDKGFILFALYIATMALDENPVIRLVAVVMLVLGGVLYKMGVI